MFKRVHIPTVAAAVAVVGLLCQPATAATKPTKKTTKASTKPTTKASTPAATAPLITTAASNTDGCNAAKTTLRVTYLSPGDPAAQIAKKTLETRYPGLKVDTVKSDATGYDGLTQQIVADIATGRDVDVIMSGLGQVRFWVDTYKPSPIDLKSLRSTYLTKFLDLGTVNGKPYVAPFQVSVPVLAYNKDLVRQAGLDPNAPPKTIDELIAQAKTVRDALKDVTPVFIPTDTIADWNLQGFVQSAGGELVDDAGNPAFDSPAAKKGLAIYEQLAKNKLADTVPFAQGTASFYAGKTAFFLTTSSASASMAAAVGNKFTWSMIPQPVAAGGSGKYPAGGNGWMVLTDDRCKAAFGNQLIAEMLEPETLASSLQTFGYFPVDSQAAKALDADPKLLPQVRTVRGFDVKLTPWGGWHGNTTPKANKAIELMTQRMLAGSSVDTAVATAVNDIKAG